MPTSGTGNSRRAVTALALFVGAWVWLALRPSPPLHEDSSRDLAFARDLVDGAVLHRHGAWASFASLEQGTAWIDLLAACQLAGLGIVGIERVLTTLLAASVALAFLGFASLLPARGGEDARASVGALVGALVLLAALPIVCELPILWQPLLLPVPLVLAHLSMWRLLRDGAPIDALALSVFCALALDVHVVSAAMVVLAVVAVPLATRRPLITTPLAIALGLGCLALSSWDAVWDNLDIMVEHGWLTPTLVLGGLGVGLAGLARARFARLEWPAKLRLALAVELGMLALLVAASLSDATPSLTGRYLSPLLPAVALACGLLSERARTRGAALASLGLALLLVLVNGARLRPASARTLPIYPAWRIAAFEPIAAELQRRELSWTDAVARLQGPGTAMMLGHLSSLLTPGSSSPTRPEQGLLLLGVSNEQAARLAGELPPARVTSIALADMQALLIDTPARTDRLGAQLCSDGQACTEVVLAVTSRVYQAHVSAWVEAEPAAVWLAGEGELPADIQWRVPVRKGEPVSLMLSSTLPEHCAWMFVAAEGFEPSTPLPTHVLELSGEAEGSLLLSRRRDDSERACIEHGLFPPAIIETEPTWTTLRELLAPPW